MSPLDKDDDPSNHQSETYQYDATQNNHQDSLSDSQNTPQLRNSQKE